MMSWWGYTRSPFELGIGDSPREEVPTETQRETSVLVDASFLARPEILREGFEVWLERRVFLPGKRQRSVTIRSLAELSIKTEYFTDNGTAIIRPTMDYVRLGNCVKIPVPQDVHLQVLVATSKPSLSGELSLPVFQIALENFTKQRVEDGLGFNIQIGDKIEDKIIIFRKLEFMEPARVYFTPDRYLRVKRKLNGGFKFSFDVMRMMAARPIPVNCQVFGNATRRAAINAAGVSAASRGGYYKSAKVSGENNENAPQPRKRQTIQQKQNENDIPPIREIGKPPLTRRKMVHHQEGAPPPPPPPPPPGLPPPPPLTTTGSLNEPPKKRLRPLRWQTIPNKDVENTFWNALNPNMLTTSTGKVCLDTDEIENLFSVSPSRPKKKGGKGQQQKKQMNSSVLGLRRGNNVGLLLAGYKKVFPSHEDISRAIRDGDLGKLTSNHLESLCSLMPISQHERDDLAEVLDRKKAEEAKWREEEEREGEEVVQKGKRKSLIPPSDLFLADLMTIPRLETKLRILYFLSKFSSILADANRLASTLSSATTEVRTSEKLFPILHLILELGKVLNQYSYQRNASGFRLCTLLKLSEVKTKDRRKTLLHYVVQNVQKKMPRHLLSPKDMPSLEVASTFGMKDLKSVMRDLSRGFDIISRELEETNDEEKEGCKFHSVVGEFVEGTKKEWVGVKEMVGKVEKEFEELAVYVGEQATIDSQELFSIVHQFHKLFLVTIEDLERAERMKEKKMVQKEKGMTRTKMDMHEELLKRASELVGSVKEEKEGEKEGEKENKKEEKMEVEEEN